MFHYKVFENMKISLRCVLLERKKLCINWKVFLKHIGVKNVHLFTKR